MGKIGRIAATALLGVVMAAPAWAQWKPAGVIHFVLPFSASGATDLMGRFVASEVQRATGNTTVVDNKPGAGGMIGAAFVAKAPADGLTVCVCTNSTLSGAGLIGPKPGYDPETDLLPVAGGWSNALVIVARPDVPFKTIPELIAYAKANPNKLNYATVGFGGTTHVGGEFLRHLAGVTWTNVSYKGEAEIISALLSGSVDFGPVSLISSGPGLVDEGKLRAISMLTSAARSPRLPSVPLITEYLPEYSNVPYAGFNVPAGTPEPVIRALSDWIRTALTSPAGQDAMAKTGILPLALDTAQYAALIKDSRAKLAKLVQDTGIKAD